MKKILGVVQTASSGIDAVLPVLICYRLKSTDYHIKLIILSPYYSWIINRSWIKHICDQYNIEIYQLTDISRIKFFFSILDRLAITFRSFQFSKIKIFKSKLSLLLKRKADTFYRMVISWITQKSLNLRKYNNVLSSDICFFDLREKSNFVGREYLFQYFHYNQPLTYLMPHSSHDIRSEHGRRLR